MALRRSALLVLLLGVVLPCAWPLEVDSGRLRLVLHEGIGRFSLYADGQPLFIAQDPRSSGLALLLDDRVYKLGDSTEFLEKAETGPGGAAFSFSAKRCTVTEGFSLQGENGLVLTITVTNRSERDLAAGIRFLLDTNLGENGQPHFLTSRDRQITSETSYDRADLPEYWLSRSSRDAGAPGLQGILTGEGVTAPDRLVLANWKRLKEAAWSYEAAVGRSFSDLPYSINDSAVCQFYDPLTLAPGATRTVTIRLAVVGAAAGPLALTARSDREELGLLGDLRVLNGVLQQLERKLQTRAGLSGEELRLIEQILADLKKRLEKTAE